MKILIHNKSFFTSSTSFATHINSDTSSLVTNTQNSINNENKPKLPNFKKLADLFIKEYPKLKYCRSYNTFYFYENYL